MPAARVKGEAGSPEQVGPFANVWRLLKGFHFLDEEETLLVRQSNPAILRRERLNAGRTSGQRGGVKAGQC